VKSTNAMIAALSSALLLSACATQPIGPTVQVMPAQGKPFEKFAQDETTCKSYADGQIAGAVKQANDNALTTGVLTTALGAGTGALLGGGGGARVGTAAGAAAGADAGASSAAAAQGTIQQRYDAAYSACMYSKGNQVPGFEPAVAAPVPAVVVPVAPAAPRFDPTLVAAIKTELSRLGLLTGAPDGAYGPKTRGAISDYEKIRGLPRDGIPTAALLDDLKQN
jgi:peptidoglycan hydrolase-like protein with peptidoglycan-binding domain